ncbi:MAG: hypothetical protein AAFV53_43295, partial [Myxococcota bacterium]
MNEPTPTPPRDPREGASSSIVSLILGVLGAILVLGFIAYAIVIGDLENINPAAAVSGALGALSLGGWIYLEQSNFRRLAASQSARYNATTVLLTIVALGIAVAL